MTNYLLTLSYDGRNFHGYQIQTVNGVEKRTVGGELKKALLTLFGSVSGLSGCSRTDAGVHSTGYRVSFSSEKLLPENVVIRALNAKLPKDIAVLSCRYVDDDFHARYSVVSKKYEYRIYSSTVRDPFKDGLYLYYPFELDENLLRSACKDFIGEHDFRSFMASGSKITNTVRTVYECDFRRVNACEYVFSVRADGFLYNMVRIMVGTLLDIQSGKLAPDFVPLIIKNRDRASAGHTAPPDGLYLCEVTYDKF